MSQKPLCAVYEECGGCQYQHMSYAEELLAKTALLKQSLEPLALSEHIFSSIVPSPQEYYYRNRLDLRLNRYKNGDIKIGFFPEGINKVMLVDHCPIARREINDYIAQVKAEAVKKLTPRYIQASLVIRSGDGLNTAWGGIGEGSLKMDPMDYFWTDIGAYRVHYGLENFFQANLYILPKVFEVIRALPIWSKESIFFDLYGGVGLFGIGVYDLVGRVALIEQNMASVMMASYNKTYNQLKNFDLYDGNVEFVLPKLFKHYGVTPKIVMVDPPRAGLTKESVKWLNELVGVNHLLYLSCHPESLAKNLRQMKSHWQIEQVMPFDFFPRTRHIETLVWLKPHPVA